MKNGPYTVRSVIDVEDEDGIARRFPLLRASFPAGFGSILFIPLVSEK